MELLSHLSWGLEEGAGACFSPLPSLCLWDWMEAPLATSAIYICLPFWVPLSSTTVYWFLTFLSFTCK